ncbi:uncharacterized protein LOC106778406 [Vigna radiata var. radiata]|uniref:Uncharacterized protein LOC106778406 n=1 Tax=Vigna radiata var. radiata TaxID=3916 RepID=A0A1S3VU75_VIGRR|nr:uncharacterized protein LOC106778406 [Vigna radiata var. radiata]
MENVVNGMMEDGYNEPANDEHQTLNQTATLKKTQVKDRSTLYFLYNAVDELGFEKIANAKSTKEAWEILEVAYKGDIRLRQVRVQALRREFEHMEMDDKEGVVEFIARVQKMANQLRMNEEEVPPNRIAEKILRNLTDDSESIVVTIEETTDLSTLIVEELVGSFKANELRRKKKKRELDDRALQAQFDSNETRNTQSRGPEGRGRGGRGRGGRDRGNFENDSKVQTDQQNCHDRGQGNDRGDRSKVECFKCGNHGHYANECRSRKCYNYGKYGYIDKYCKVETKGETNFLTKEEDECGILLMAKSSNVVDMESLIPTMDDVISVNGATNAEKENLEKELKQKDEKIKRIGRLLDEANEIMNKQRVELEKLKKVALEKEEKTFSVLEPDGKEKDEDEDVEKNQGMRSSNIEIAKDMMSKILDKTKKSAKIIEKPPMVINKLVKVIEKSSITKSVKALERSTNVKDMRVRRKRKKSNMVERSKPGVG